MATRPTPTAAPRKQRRINDHPRTATKPKRNHPWHSTGPIDRLGAWDRLTADEQALVMRQVAAFFEYIEEKQT